MNKFLLTALATALLPASGPAQTFLGKDRSVWVKELSGGSAAGRRSAAFALGKIGSVGDDAVSQLAAVLKDDNAAVRDAAAFALGDIATGSAQNGRDVWSGAGRLLLDRLGDSDAHVRRSAAVALGSCGPAARTAVPALSKVLEDQKNLAVVRRSAAWALGKIGKGDREGTAVASLKASLRDSNPLVLRDVAGALGDIGRPGAESAAPVLAEVVRDTNDPAVRKAALATLVGLVDPSMAKDPPDKHTVLVEVLGKALREGDAETKGLAAGALANLGEHAAPVLNDLAALLNDETVPPATRRNVALALANIPRTIRRLPSDQREAVVRKLGRALTTAFEGRRKLSSAEVADLAQARTLSGEALARIGFPDAEPVVRELLQALRKDPDPKVRHRAVWAFLNADIQRLPGVVDALLACLKDSNKSLAYDAARGLAKALKQDAPKAVIDTLETMLDDPSIKIYYKTNADVKGGSESSGGQSNVSAVIGGDGRFMAAQALASIGPAANRPGILKMLKELKNSPDKRVREECAKALVTIDK